MASMGHAKMHKVWLSLELRHKDGPGGRLWPPRTPNRINGPHFAVTLTDNLAHVVIGIVHCCPLTCIRKYRSENLSLVTYLGQVGTCLGVPPSSPGWGYLPWPGGTYLRWGLPPTLTGVPTFGYPPGEGRYPPSGPDKGRYPSARVGIPQVWTD